MRVRADVQKTINFKICNIDTANHEWNGDDRCDNTNALWFESWKFAKQLKRKVIRVLARLLAELWPYKPKENSIRCQFAVKIPKRNSKVHRTAFYGLEELRLEAMTYIDVTMANELLIDVTNSFVGTEKKKLRSWLHLYATVGDYLDEDQVERREKGASFVLLLQVHCAGNGQRPTR